MRVRVYFNLRRKVFSVMDKKTRRVIAHLAEVGLTDVRFIVSESGRQRVLREKVKNVHAFVEGTLGLTQPIEGVAVSYNPYKAPTFVERDSGLPVHSAPRAFLQGRSVTIGS